MKDQDRDLILDLVAGRLSEHEAVKALARVSNDSDLSAAYAEQLAVHDALNDAEPVVMSATESSLLRAALVEQLHLADLPAITNVSAPTRRLWWKPAAALSGAAAVVIVTAIIVLPGTLSGVSSDSGDAFMAEAPATAKTSTTAAASGLAEERDSESLAPAADSGGAQEMGSAGEFVAVPNMPGINPKDLLETTLGQASPPEIEETLVAAGLNTSIDIDSLALRDCATQATAFYARGSSPLILGAETSGTSTIVYLGILGSSGIETVLSVDLADCRVLDSVTELDLIED
jgi:hypothetical protein